MWNWTLKVGSMMVVDSYLLHDCVNSLLQPHLISVAEAVADPSQKKDHLIFT